MFGGAGKCATCHVPPRFTEPGYNMHTAAEIGIDDFQASRAPDRRYRTTPLAGLWTHTKGGFYHDGRFATLPDVVRHYDGTFGLGLRADEVGERILRELAEEGVNVSSVRRVAGAASSSGDSRRPARGAPDLRLH